MRESFFVLRLREEAVAARALRSEASAVTWRRACLHRSAQGSA